VEDDRVFKALADVTRRHLLDRLFERDGRTLTELESELEMTRFGVMKHLHVLEDAGLIATSRSGREKLRFLNPVPIRLIHDRWIDKYTERHVSALAELKNRLEEIGNRSSEAWFALTHLLDYPDARVYYGSWVEWGKTIDTPVER
jgi:DNA-binding transcriptional ArsR family regulator